MEMEDGKNIRSVISKIEYKFSYMILRRTYVHPPGHPPHPPPHPPPNPPPPGGKSSDKSGKM